MMRYLLRNIISEGFIFRVNTMFVEFVGMKAGLRLTLRI